VKTCQRSLALDYAVAIVSLYVATGFFLDAWAHQHVPVETFFTPYHAMFYSGMLVLMLLYAGFWLRHRALPPGYAFAAIGIPIFCLAGVGDMIWHFFLGIEEGVDAVLSPTHQALGAGIALMASAPIRSVLADRERSTTWQLQLPLVLSTATFLTLVHFSTQFIFDPGAGPTNTPILHGTIALGYDKAAMGALVAIFQSMLMCVFALWMVGRIRPIRGAFTIVFPLGNFAIAGSLTNQSPLFLTTLAQSFVAGVVADMLVARTDPSPQNPRWYRIFAVAVPLAYAGEYLAYTAGAGGLWWNWNETLGTWVCCGIAGFALSLIGTARRTAA
jgi:hypothetical protein